jgi:hypothetical protein
MESSTKILRRLLDERGVEHYDGTEMTLWLKDGMGYRASADEGLSGYIHLHLWCTTPEQAIAATLGTLTCYDEGDPSDFCCSECGVRMFTNTSDTYTMVASDGRTIIKHPNYCPNCGRRCVG